MTRWKKFAPQSTLRRQWLDGESRAVADIILPCNSFDGVVQPRETFLREKRNDGHFNYLDF